MIRKLQLVVVLAAFLPVLLRVLLLLLFPGLDHAARFLAADALTWLLLAFVVVLGSEIVLFSVSNLAGDPRRGSFLLRLGATLWGVQGLIMSGNFLVFFVFWIWTSMGLHALLTFYGDRPRAILTARKKFAISRLGDLALLTAGYLLWRKSGHLSFAALSTTQLAGPVREAIGILIVLGALTKSAQVPFHSWLPQTLDTPTSVSALMHAGVINAGGILVLRFMPLIRSSEVALSLLLAIGTLSVVWALLVQLTQTDVKRRLAWSTVGQMGFLMVELGWGLFGLAVAHLIGHGLYKARAFLESGERPPRPVPVTGFSLTGALVAVALGVVLYLSRGAAGLLPVALVIPLLIRRGSAVPAALRLGGGVVLAVASAYLALVMDNLLGLASALPAGGGRLIVAIASLILFAGLSAFTATLPAWSRRRFAQRLWSASLRGFGYGTWLEKLFLFEGGR